MNSSAGSQLKILFCHNKIISLFSLPVLAGNLYWILAHSFWHVPIPWLMSFVLYYHGADIHRHGAISAFYEKNSFWDSWKFWNSTVFSSVQSLSRVRLFVTPWTAARQASLSITNSRSLLKLTSIKSVMPSNHLILCCPLLLPPLIFPSIRVFSNESALRIGWSKYWSFSFSIYPSNEYSGLTSFRMDRLDLLAVQGTLKSLLQHHSSKASILLCSAFFTVQLSHPYMTTGKTIALTRRTSVGKVISIVLQGIYSLV